MSSAERRLEPLSPAEDRLPVMRVALWGIVSVLVLALLGPARLRDLRPAPGVLCDFFQDWAAANYYWEGLSPYSTQRLAAALYLGREVELEHARMPFNEVNAHPPPVVLLVLPLARLDYPTAQGVWNLIWLAGFLLAAGLVWGRAGVRAPPGSVLIWIPLLLTCTPLRAELNQGQFNRALVLLLVVAWMLEREGKPTLAGLCLGTAASLKLTPAFVFLYFLCRRQWRVLAGGALGFITWNGLALLVFGFDAYQDYALRVIPATAARYGGDPVNASLAAFWSRLFGSAEGGAEPVVECAVLRSTLLTLSRGLIVLLAGWVSWQARTRAAREQALGAVIIGMLLVSPITWPPYFLLLLLPAIFLWRDLAPGSVSRVLFLASLGYLWISDLVIVGLLKGDYWRHQARPWESLSYLAAPTYALLILFAAALGAARDRSVGAEP